MRLSTIKRADCLVDYILILTIFIFFSFHVLDLKRKNTRMRQAMRAVVEMPAGDVIDSPVYVQEILFKALEETR